MDKVKTVVVPCKRWAGTSITTPGFLLKGDKVSTNSKIEWTDATWNPVVGCSKCSPGCDNCYAEKMARRLKGIASKPTIAPPPAGIAKYKTIIGSNGGWNGKLNINDAEITDPLCWRKARNVFVCSMGDLFHQNMNVLWIDQIFAIMIRAQKHTFRLLTKRPANMRAYMKRIIAYPELIKDAAFGIGGKDFSIEVNDLIHQESETATGWPPKNIWLGTTVCNQKEYDINMCELICTQAHIRFLSIEPMLSAVNLTCTTSLDWVICGGETGPGARPVKYEWIESLRDQCVNANVSFFFKSWGNSYKLQRDRKIDGREWNQVPASVAP